MNCYKPSVPRAKLGLTAVAAAAITIVALVALPAKFESHGNAPPALVAAKTTPGSVGRASTGPF